MSAHKSENFFEAMELVKARAAEPPLKASVDHAFAPGSVNAWSEAINSPKDSDAVLRAANERAANSWFAGLDASKRAEATKKAESASAHAPSMIQRPA